MDEADGMIADYPSPYHSKIEVHDEYFDDILDQITTKKAQGGLIEVPTVPWPMQIFAGGGMVEIRRPSALPPTRGPQSGGLPSLYNNVRKW